MPSLYMFSLDGARVFGPESRSQIGEVLIAAFQSRFPSALPFVTVDGLGTELVATIENGEVISVEPSVAYHVWLHMNMAGGDGSDPIGVDITNTTITPILFSAQLRQTADPYSAIIAKTYDYRITMRCDGSVYDVRSIHLESGIMTTIGYQGNKEARAGIVQVFESDFEKVTVGANTYTVHLAQPVLFKVYRNM